MASRPDAVLKVQQQLRDAPGSVVTSEDAAGLLEEVDYLRDQVQRNTEYATGLKRRIKQLGGDV